MEHIVKQGESLSKIAQKYDVQLAALLAANPRYKADPNKLSVGDVLVIPKGEADNEVSPTAAHETEPASQDENEFVVEQGQLTFDAEGMEKPGKYFSRKLHVPGAWSGATIGRGYDMRERSESEIASDLASVGVDLVRAQKLATCRGLRGSSARTFIEENNLADIEISAAEQKALFILAYQELEGDVIRICSKNDVVTKYGVTEWDNLHPVIKDIAVDLRYRGDYTGATREQVQRVLVDNDPVLLKAVLSDKDYWVDQRNVPGDRFNRRKKYIEKSLG